MHRFREPSWIPRSAGRQCSGTSSCPWGAEAWRMVVSENSRRSAGGCPARAAGTASLRLRVTCDLM